MVPIVHVTFAQEVAKLCSQSRFWFLEVDVPCPHSSLLQSALLFLARFQPARLAAVFRLFGSLNMPWIANLSLILVFASGCLSTKHVVEGVQPDYEALNPSRIIAVPILLLPNPSLKVEVDKALVESDKVVAMVEKEVLNSFRNQPNVNGVSFQAVRQTLGPQSKLLKRMESQMRSTSALLISTEPSDRASLTRDCLARKSFLDFYAFCVASDAKWTDQLNQLSRTILNADTALITVITEYSKSIHGKQNVLQLALATMVVDTNSGRIIWGREAQTKLEAANTEPLPSLATNPASIFSQDHWLNFPGRNIPLKQDGKAP